MQFKEVLVKQNRRCRISYARIEAGTKALWSPDNHILVHPKLWEWERHDLVKSGPASHIVADPSLELIGIQAYIEYVNDPYINEMRFVLIPDKLEFTGRIRPSTTEDGVLVWHPGLHFGTGIYIIRRPPEWQVFGCLKEYGEDTRIIAPLPLEAIEWEKLHPNELRSKLKSAENNRA